MPPRLIRPKNDSSANEDSEATGEGRSGKRKTVSSACIPCRRRKSKCDGQLPACSTCIAVYRTECSYDADIDARRKPPIKRESSTSASLQNDALDIIVSSLRTLPENDAVVLLQQLRGDSQIDQIASALRGQARSGLFSFNSQSQDTSDFAQPFTPTISTLPERPNYLSSSSRHPSVDDGASHSTNAASAAAVIPAGAFQSWFTQPQDREFIEHLLNLYFCWIHPFHPFVSRSHFIHDMERGGTEYCSSILLHAMLAFACHYSDRAQARADPNDPSTTGDQYYAEAQRLLLRIDDGASSLTTIQALGILSLRETSAGKDSNAYRYAGRSVRMALEMGLHLSVMKNGIRPPEHELRKNLFWSVFGLETSCALAFGRLSQLPRSAADIELPAANPTTDDDIWRPYEDTNLAMSPSTEQPARLALLKEYSSKLFELASDMVNTFYAPRERFTSRRLAASYGLYQAWYRNLPEELRLTNTSLPHVLVLHMYYYGCVLHLFRPYVKLDLSGANLFPRDTCTFCANEISTIMNALRGMYGLRRVCVSVTTILLSAATIHLLNLPTEPAATHLTQALHDLAAISVNHRFAARSIDIIRSLSTKWGITLPETAANVSVYRPTGRLEVSSPPSSTFFAASISRNTSGESQTTDDSPFPPPGSMKMGPPAQVQAQLDPSMPIFFSDPATTFDTSHGMTAFWTPFPAQGMPIPSQIGDTFETLERQHTQGPHWQHAFARNRSRGGAQDLFGRQQSAPGRLDEPMGGMSDWNWT